MPRSRSVASVDFTREVVYPFSHSKYVEVPLNSRRQPLPLSKSLRAFAEEGRHSLGTIRPTRSGDFTSDRARRSVSHRKLLQSTLNRL